MKRIVIWFCLISMMAFCIPAQAEWELPIVNENFSIRNGIHYGININDAVAVEKANGNVPDSLYEASIYFKDISFLGKNITWLDYHFTTDDKLSSFAYSGMDNYHTYRNIYETLSEKYGEPMLTDEFSLFSTAIWKNSDLMIFNFMRPGEWNADTLSCRVASSSNDGTLWISEYAVWLIKYSDCSVVIELAEVSKRSGVTDLTLGYAFISHDSMEAWLEYRQEKSEEAANSYANDI